MVAVAVVSFLVLARYLPETLGRPLDESGETTPVAQQAAATALGRD